MEQGHATHALTRKVAWLAIIWVVLATSRSFAQSYIDIDSPIGIKYDGNASKTIQLEASLVYGFAYRVPLNITVSEGVDVSSLHGSTICNCVSFSIKNGRVMDPKAPAKGFLLIKPKSEDLFQVIDIMGTRAGEVDPVLIAKINLACEVYHPMKLSPAMIEVKDGRLSATDVRVELADEVKILDVQLLDSNSLRNFDFDRKTQRVVVVNKELPQDTDSGQLVLRFNLSLMGQNALYETVVPYEPRKPLRLIPSTLTIRKVDDRYEARFVIVGFSVSQKDPPLLSLEKQIENGNWTLVDADIRVETFASGKVVGKISVAPKSIDFENDKTPKLRLRNEDESVVLEDVRAVLAR